MTTLSEAFEQHKLTWYKQNSDWAKGFADYFERTFVWAKGLVVPGLDPKEWRRDGYGSLMKFSEHGNCSSEYGWEIDHIMPVERGGSEDLANKQPLQWSNNRSKGDKVPSILAQILSSDRRK